MSYNLALFSAAQGSYPAHKIGESVNHLTLSGRRLPLAGCQTLLGPVVSCGPPGVVLSRSVILSMDHCSDGCLDNWALRLKKQNYEGVWEVRR